eukprot:81641-Chlamydomonas_euryale.AAC.5
MHFLLRLCSITFRRLVHVCGLAGKRRCPSCCRSFPGWRAPRTNPVWFTEGHMQSICRIPGVCCDSIGRRRPACRVCVNGSLRAGTAAAGAAWDSPAAAGVHVRGRDSARAGTLVCTVRLHALCNQGQGCTPWRSIHGAVFQCVHAVAHTWLCFFGVVCCTGGSKRRPPTGALGRMCCGSALWSFLCLGLGTACRTRPVQGGWAWKQPVRGGWIWTQPMRRGWAWTLPVRGGWAWEQPVRGGWARKQRG